MDKCQFCGDVFYTAHPHIATLEWACGTMEVQGELARGDRCYETELAAQAALLLECRGAMLKLIEWVRLDMIEMQREGHVVSHLAVACDEAQALVKRLEEVKEVDGGL